MNRITRAFEHRHEHKAVIPFLVAADPSYAESLAQFQTLLAAGADMLEIGIPYSDPLADGPVIQNASLRSLQGGFTLPDAFQLVRDLRRVTDKALILFTYVNPVLQFGIRKFCDMAVAAGADGLIIPDLPFEEAEPIRSVADSVSLALIPLVAPTSDDVRIQKICSQARGFVYCVATLGVTGVRTALSAEAKQLVQRVRNYTDLPVAVGFGISSPEQAKETAQFADGVIIGSAYIRHIEAYAELKNSPYEQSLQLIHDFTLQFVAAVKTETQINRVTR